MGQESYRDILIDVVNFLKKEKREHEGTDFAVTPSGLLDRIAGLSSGLPDIIDVIYGGMNV